jgi:RNA-directed DNA polymerase
MAVLLTAAYGLEPKKLTVNEEKTRICKVPEGEFDFLGYTFGRMYCYPE